MFIFKSLKFFLLKKIKLAQCFPGFSEKKNFKNPAYGRFIKGKQVYSQLVMHHSRHFCVSFLSFWLIYYLPGFSRHITYDFAGFYKTGHSLQTKSFAIVLHEHSC